MSAPTRERDPLAQLEHSLFCDIQKAMGRSRSEISRKTGLSVETVVKALRGHLSNPRTRAKIEAALGEPLWSDREEFEARLPMIRFFGDVDIDAASLPELRAIILEHGLSTKMVWKASLARQILRDHFQNQIEGSNQEDDI